MGLILLLVLGILVFGALPLWAHARSWGYGPSIMLGLVLIVLVVLLLLGALPFL